jgi:hypothetical protein
MVPISLIWMGQWESRFTSSAAAGSAATATDAQDGHPAWVSFFTVNLLETVLLFDGPTLRRKHYYCYEINHISGTEKQEKTLQ